MENIQPLIDWLIAEKEKALELKAIYEEDDDTPLWTGEAIGKAKAFNLVLDQVELLYRQKRNSDTPPQLNKHDVSGQLPPTEVDRLIQTIYVNDANFKHIAVTQSINGTLLVELRRVINEAVKISGNCH